MRVAVQAAVRNAPLAQAARPRPRQLWYAVVFPDLTESLAGEHISTGQIAIEQLATSMLQRLSLTALQFTSLVSIEMPNALLLEIRGSVKLFGSLSALCERMDAAWERIAMRAHSATAPTTLAALWCARGGKRVCIDDSRSLAGMLAELPLACTAWQGERLQTLRAMGVTRVGELLRLPRGGIARRLGPSAILDLDIALARQAAPRRAFVPRERFRERYDAETEIETVIYLQNALEPLLGRCAQFLRERQAGVQALELRLRHRAVPPTRVRLGLASITGERRRLTDVVNERLSRLELVAPVRSMELLSGSLQPLPAGSLDAFARAHAGDTAPQLVERLRARLGEAAVYGVAAVPEHRPEAAWRRVHELRLSSVSSGPTLMRPSAPARESNTGNDVRDVGAGGAGHNARDVGTGGAGHNARGVGTGGTGDNACGVGAGGTGEKACGVGAGGTGENARAISAGGTGYDARAIDAPPVDMPRPLWLLEAPVPLSANLQPERQEGLILEEGPERIESGWWDGKGVARDYYIARVHGARPDHGARWWIFQERQTRNWYLHGVFA